MFLSRVLVTIVVYSTFVSSIYRFVQKRLMALAEDGRSIVNELFWYKRNSGSLKENLLISALFKTKSPFLSRMPVGCECVSVTTPS